MFHILENRIASRVSEYLRAQYGAGAPVSLEQPKQSSFGELAIPVAFQMARQLKRAPKAIADELVKGLGEIDGVAALEVAGNGYINVRLDRGAYGASLLQRTDAQAEACATFGKIIVEHTNINPNKAAHIGHLRNAILGDTFVRMLRAAGRQVEVQNYIDNTGVQVADVVVAFHHLEKLTPQAVQRLIESTDRPFDYVCWDLYARVSTYYNDHPEALHGATKRCTPSKPAQARLAELAHLVADAIVNAHLATMLRLDIEYDVLPRESEILHLQFWATAFELLKERKAIYFETEGKNTGCWVMPGSAFSDRGRRRGQQGDRALQRHRHLRRQGHRLPALEVRTAGQGFLLPPLDDLSGRHESCGPARDHPAEPSAPAFGRGQRVYNVIDSRQSYLQDVVVAGLRALGYNEQADRSIHFSYEMVALSPGTCVELGIELSEEDKRKPYVEVSGRKGLRRESRRSDRQADREGAGRSGLAPSGSAAEASGSRWPRISPSARCATSC